MAKEPQDYKRKREPFRFQIAGADYTLRPPTLNQMKAAKDAGDDIDGMLDVFAACGDESLVAAVGDLELPDVNQLFRDWIVSYAPDGDAGKSSGSSS